MNLAELINVAASLRLAETIYKGEVPLSQLLAAFQQPLELKAVSEESVLLKERKRQKNFVVEPNWQRLSTCKAANFSKANEKRLLANTQLLLTAFQTYLEQHDGLVKKTVQRHVSNASDYLNGYLLYYGINLAVSNFEVIGDFFSWGGRKGLWNSETAVRRAGASLKKFYHFLLAAGEVNSVDMLEIREEIEIGVKSVANALELWDDPYGFF